MFCQGCTILFVLGVNQMTNEITDIEDLEEAITLVHKEYQDIILRIETLTVFTKGVLDLYDEIKNENRNG